MQSSGGGADAAAHDGVTTPAPVAPPEPLPGLLGVDTASAEGTLRRLLLREGGQPQVELEAKSFSDCRYLGCKALGLSLRVKPASAEGRTDVAFLYQEGVDGFSEYRSGPLPYGLMWSDTSRDVVRKLGEPSDKFGGGRLPINICYETLGLDVHFKHCSWEDACNPLQFLSVFEAKMQLVSADLCAVCAKRARFRCSLCKSHSYCSSACQKGEWSAHKAVCRGRKPAVAIEPPAAAAAGTPRERSGTREDAAGVPEAAAWPMPGLNALD